MLHCSQQSESTQLWGQLQLFLSLCSRVLHSPGSSQSLPLF